MIMQLIVLKRQSNGGGLHSTVDSALAFHLATLGLIHFITKFFWGILLSEFLDVAVLIVSTALLIEWTVQIKSLIVDRTHLVLASGKSVLQETILFRRNEQRVDGRSRPARRPDRVQLHRRRQSRVHSHPHQQPKLPYDLNPRVSDKTGTH